MAVASNALRSAPGVERRLKWFVTQVSNSVKKAIETWSPSGNRVASAQNGSVDFECEFPNSIGNKMAELPLLLGGAVQVLSHQPFA